MAAIIASGCVRVEQSERALPDGASEGGRRSPVMNDGGRGEDEDVERTTTDADENNSNSQQQVSDVYTVVDECDGDLDSSDESTVVVDESVPIEVDEAHPEATTKPTTAAH